MFRRRLWHVIFVLAIGIQSALSQTVGEYELKAAMIYKFVQFTDWPNEEKNEFIFCVLGKNPFGTTLDDLEGKTFKGARVVVKSQISPNEAKSCKVLFLNAANPVELSRWLVGIQDLPILTISDKPDDWDQGVMIVLSSEPNRITFNINRTAAQRVNMDFRVQMLQLARSLR